MCFSQDGLQWRSIKQTLWLSDYEDKKGLKEQKKSNRKTKEFLVPQWLLQKICHMSQPQFLENIESTVDSTPYTGIQWTNSEINASEVEFGY